MPRSRPRRSSSSNAIIFAAIGSSPPRTFVAVERIEPTPATDGHPAGQSHPAGAEASSPRSCLGVVTLDGRVPTTCLALSPRECKPRGRRETLPFELRDAHRDRYNRGMSATEKLAISLPKDLIEKLRRAKDEGRIESVSGHIADLLRREDDWRDARATLDRIFERCPDPEAKHYAWARQVLGVGPKPAA